MRYFTQARDLHSMRGGAFRPKIKLATIDDQVLIEDTARAKR
jgi:hypothetical protein